jgi:hypothetical protein
MKRTLPDGRWWALLALLAAITHASLFGVGAVGEDHRLLALAARAADGAGGDPTALLVDLLREDASGGDRPLATLSLRLSGWLWTSDGVWTHFALGMLRLENLLLLGGIAWLLASVMRRLVGPWTGSEQALAASWGALAMLVVHPLSASAVASPLARGDLLGGLFGMLAGAAFLRGRQERRYRLVVLSGLATLLAVAASELGYLLPPWLAVMEYASARRYRPRPVRLRTALTTAVVFGGLLALDVALRAGLEVEPWPAGLRRSLSVLGDPADLLGALLRGLTQLGVLILPVNGANAGGLGFVVGAVLLVVVVQPALHAGLSAPRFWVTSLGVWLAVMVLVLATRAGLDVGPTDFSRAALLFPAVVVMAAGLSLASTALSGTRRQAIPVVVACLLCTLARSNARGWRAAAKDVDELGRDLAAQVERHGAAPRYLVLDPPGRVDLYDTAPADLAWIADRALRGGSVDATALSVRGISVPDLLAYSRLEAFDELRARGLVAVFEGRLVDEGLTRPRWVGEALGRGAGAGQVLAWRGRPAPEDAPRTDLAGAHWVGPVEDVPPFADSGSIECLTVRLPDGAEPAAMLGRPPEVLWRPRGGVVRKGELGGVWLQDGEGLTAVFDPGSELRWLLGPRIEDLLPLGELAAAPEVEAWSRPPAIQGVRAPSVDGDAWDLGRPSPLAPLDPELELTWRLVLLDLERLEGAELAGELDADGVLVVPGAEERAVELRTRPGTLAWGLERRVGGVLVERSGGRL